MPNDPKRVQELFLQIVVLSPEQRSEALECACGGDLELRRRVEALLRAHDEPDSLLDQPTLLPDPEQPGAASEKDSALDAATFHSAQASPQLPSAPATAVMRADTIIAGRYRLQHKIGEGGMGEVWVAKQTEPVKRKVALKLIKTGMDSQDVLARFEQERQALALMDHPNIARVLDGGLTPTGQPFFVMELVNGMPLTRYCDEAKLTPRERLKLFVTICQAVQHAHHKGIVHRDLKPANILVMVVDGQPVPKVIDFGVAKATAGKLTEQSMSTQFGAVVGTLEYMSPEQAGYSGTDIDTRADIYSLGVILYELLTGLRPIDQSRLKKAALLEMIMVICEEEPSKPSTRLSTDAALPSLAAVRQTDPKRLMAMLRGELDWVVMKCLEKSRDRRYETASGLARDIERYLADEPVEARPPSFGYRVGKLLRRNKGPVVAAALVLLSLVGGVVGTTIGLVQAERQRSRAELQRSKAVEARKQAELAADTARVQTTLALDTLNTVIFDIQRGLENVPGAGAVRKKLLKTALERLEQIAREFVTAGTADLQTIAALNDLGDVFLRIGTSEEAGDAANSGPIRAARKVYSQAMEIAKKLAADNPDDANVRLQLSATYHKLGHVSLQTGQATEALRYYELGHDIATKLVVDAPENAELREHLAASYANLGAVNLQLGKLAAANGFYRQAFEIDKELAVSSPTDMSAQQRLAVSYTALGNISQQAGQLAESVEFHRQALEILKQVAAADLGNAAAQRNLATSFDRLGHLNHQLGRFRAALDYYRQCHDITVKLAKAAPDDVQAQRDLSISYERQGELSWQMGQRTDAVGFHRQALEIRRKLAAADPDDARAQRDLHVSCGKLGDLHLLAGEFDQAEPLYQQGFEIAKKLAATDPNDAQAQRGLTAAYDWLGELHMRTGRLDEALEFFRQAFRIRSQLAAAAPDDAQAQRDLIISHIKFGIAHRLAGDYSQSVASLEEGLNIARRIQQHGLLAGRLEPLIQMMQQQLQTSQLSQQAMNDWDNVIQLAEKSPQLLYFRAYIFASQKKPEQAARAAAQYRKIAQSTQGEKAEHLYQAAAAYGLCAAAVAPSEDGELPGKQQAMRREYIRLSLACLREAIDAGFDDFDRARSNPAMAVLHNLPEFEKLVEPANNESS